MRAKSGIWALGDQAAVSAGNFLLIAFGAWMLELPEQTKLVYAYTVYIATVLFNAAAIFSPAPLLRYEVTDAAMYRRVLWRLQTGAALAMVVLFLLSFLIAGPRLGWVPSGSEVFWVFAFLMLQQLADFNRRADYVFGEVRLAASLSALMLVLRVGMLLVLTPGTSEVFFVVLAVSALPGAVWALTRGRGESGTVHEPGLVRRHLRLARWNVLNAPLQWMGLHLPILLSGMLAGTGAAAILASVRSVSTAANVFLELMETYVPARMAAHARRDGQRAIRAAAFNLYVMGGIIWCVAAAAIFLFGESLLALLLGRTYAPYWPILLLLWAGNGLYFIGRVYGVGQRVMRRTSVELIGSIGGLFALIATLPLMSLYGVTGAAFVVVVVQVGCVMAQLTYARRFAGSDGA